MGSFIINFCFKYFFHYVFQCSYPDKPSGFVNYNGQMHFALNQKIK